MRFRFMKISLGCVLMLIYLLSDKKKILWFYQISFDKIPLTLSIWICLQTVRGKSAGTIHEGKSESDWH